MERKKAQNTIGQKEVCEHLVEQARLEIEDIQLAGQTVRAQIDAAKECALASIKSESEQKQSDDALAAAKRLELIKKLEESVRSGDFSEIQRIKTLLSEDESIS